MKIIFMQTILGAGGTISNELVKELVANNESFRLVSRNPKPVAGAEIKAADLTDASSVLNAVEGSDVVYLLAGLQYNINVWREQWPKIMTNVIEACKHNNSKLIFFDNVYPYGLVKGPMTEATPYNPNSKKGEVRAKIATQLMDEVKRGNLHASIARAADFYGPKNKTSVLGFLVFDKFAKGKKAQWFLNVDTVHSFTFTPDAGKAVYMLSKNESSFDQVWHIPTAANPLTGKQYIERIAKAFGVEPRYMVLGKFMIRLVGLFDRNVKELYEMLYQNEYDYVFDSFKFEKAFSFHPTSYDEGIEITAKSYKSS
jgi:nucleoside-diphosphate-sugar epimerase